MLQKSAMDSQPNSELTDIPSISSEVMNLYLSQQMRSAIGPLLTEQTSAGVIVTAL